MADTQTIRKWALQNAVKYGGKANPGAIIGKLISECADAKNNMKQLSKDVACVVKEVNSLSSAQQLAVLEKEAPELLVEKKKDETHELPDLPGAVNGKVITAFPPEPSGVAHIGHASGALFNWLLAKKYGSKFILRFEDTNPELAKLEYYAAISDLLHWLGIEWDRQINISDTLPEIYACAEKLLEKGLLYACTCEVETVRKLRESCEECSHRNSSVEVNLSQWKRMLAGQFEEGAVSIRYKGDMKSLNGVLRDPVMFRIMKKPHCLHGTKYCVWPSYDFAAAYSDGVEGVTHRVRGKEFELRAELQSELQKYMGFVPTFIMEQARINLAGVEASKRKIREKIASGALSGWEDIRLSTLIALRRRGFTPEGIKSFLLGVGITKNERTLEWSSLEAENRKVLDPVVNRYFFVQDPVKISVVGAPERLCELPLHPDCVDRGKRHLASKTDFYLSKKDFDELKQRSLYRLMDCLNFTKNSVGFVFKSQSIDDYRENGKRIMQWLPVDDKQVVSVDVCMPDATIKTGFGERVLCDLDVGTVVQFTRFGFVRLDKKEENKLVFWYTHA